MMVIEVWQKLLMSLHIKMRCGQPYVTSLFKNFMVCQGLKNNALE